MDDGPKRGGGRRNDIPWDKIQERFELGETNVSKLAKIFGVSRQAIIKRRDQEKWTTKQQLSDTVKSNVIDIATRRALEKVGGTAGLEQVASEIAEELLAQPTLLRKAAKLIDRTVDRALRVGEIDKDTGKPVKDQLILGANQGETTAVSDILNAISKLVRDGRLSHGLEEGTPTLTKADEKEQPFVVVRKVMLPTGTDGAQPDAGEKPVE